MITFLGLSHLSLCYSAAALCHGKKVLILDHEKEVDLFNKKKNQIYEPGLTNILNKFSKNFKLSCDFKNIKNSKLIFLAKDIKTDKNNNVLLEETKQLIKKVKIKKNKILIIMNQVPVGFTRNIKWNKNLLYHFVETLIFGQAIKRALNPERLIIGKNRINNKIDDNLLKYLKLFKCQIIDMTYEESELTKGFINAYLASQLITTNFLAEIANKYNSSWNRIIKAISLDKRIGTRGYYKPGLGIAGGNIERDIKTLDRITKRYNIKNKLPNFFIKANKYSKNWINRIISLQKIKNKRISILGLTYKENTLSVKNAVQIDLINKYKQCITAHDTNSKKILNSTNQNIKNSILKTLEYNLKNSNILIIFHNIDLYKNINLNKYKNIKCIIDPFGILNKKKINKKNYFKLTN